MHRAQSRLIETIFSFPPSQTSSEKKLIEFLKQVGFSRLDLVQTQEGQWSQIRVYSEKAFQAKRLERAYQSQPIVGVRFSTRHLAYRDWAEKWKEDYKIQTLGARFVVIPSWRVSEFDPQHYKRRIPMTIDPLSAFGSGEHETTQLVIRQIESLRGRFNSFADIGVGTGVLSIAAAHCGAQVIFGFDNDRPSAKCAEFNFKQNKLNVVSAEFLCLELARFKSPQPFDLVCANINSHILESYRKQIVGAAKKGGWVLLSGILKLTYDSFREAFDGSDLRCLKVLRGRRWVSVLYSKKS